MIYNFELLDRAVQRGEGILIDIEGLTGRKEEISGLSCDVNLIPIIIGGTKNVKFNSHFIQISVSLRPSRHSATNMIRFDSVSATLICFCLLLFWWNHVSSVFYDLGMFQ